MAIATIKENAMMNIFRNGFLVRKFMMVAMMTAMAVNSYVDNYGKEGF